MASSHRAIYSAVQFVSSSSSAARTAAALRFLRQQPPGTELVIVAASRGAADELARRLSVDRGATFGVYRAGFNELIGRLAAPVLARRRIGSATPLGMEAMVARVAFDAAPMLEYFAPVARMPGFPRAAARTLSELRQAGVDSAQVE